MELQGLWPGQRPVVVPGYLHKSDKDLHHPRNDWGPAGVDSLRGHGGAERMGAGHSAPLQEKKRQQQQYKEGRLGSF